VFGPIDNSIKGVSVGKEHAPKVASELVKNNISYEVVMPHKSNHVTFKWLSSYHSDAMRIVNNVKR